MEIAIIPKFLIRLLSGSDRRQYDYNVLFSSLLILLLFVVLQSSLLNVLDQLPHFCLMQETLGIPCPGCGTTRAFTEMSNGNFVTAFKLNSASVLVVSFFIIQIPIRTFLLISKKKNERVISILPQLNRITLFCILFNWIFNL
jgi:hypothetical protein